MNLIAAHALIHWATGIFYARLWIPDQVRDDKFLGEKIFVFFPQQVLLYLTHRVARQLCNYKALLGNFEVS